ncbi:MAG: ImmA/IrrE family metallo-endopeptidase [Cyanobacteria bacterium HKST-UBA02]|nr:ImmA/IrrE family metallo-endopeptidase [Cyanobacteria bacterium HKST-UBA02]
MAERIPVTPAIITWARERSGVTRKEAVKKFKDVLDWEQGRSYPTYNQIERMADAFKVPVAVFFFPEPPDLPPISETFRTLPLSEMERLPSRIRLLLRKAKAMQINLEELTEGRNPSFKLITRDLSFQIDSDISSMAAEVREYIGISIDEQMGWSDDDTALRSWRAALTGVGVFVFKDAFKADDFSGFCLFDDAFPVIYVNNSSTKTRQMFSFFHELGHLLFHTSGIDTLHHQFITRLKSDDQRVEAICNRFASEFLLPENALNQALRGREASEETAEILASQFHVSREVVYRRFLDRGLVSSRQYQKAADRWSQQRQEGKRTGGDHYWTKLTYLGRDYVSLALSQFYRNRIDENQLADYLDTKPRNLSKLEEYFDRGQLDVRV